MTSAYAQVTSGLTQGENVVTGSVSSRSGTTTAGGGININSLTGGGGLSGGFGR